MIKVICALLAIAIKDLEIYWGNANLFLGKSTIWFELLSQKRETYKQMANALDYKFLKSVS